MQIESEKLQVKDQSSLKIYPQQLPQYELPPLSNYPEELEKHFQILQTSEDKEQIRTSFVSIHTLIKSKTEYFNPRAPYHHLIEKLVSVLNRIFEKYQYGTFEFYKGLIFLSNMVLWLDKSYAETFLMTNPQLLIQLSCFYEYSYSTSQKLQNKNSNNNSQNNNNKSKEDENLQNLKGNLDIMNEYSLLALIAQLIHQTQKCETDAVQEIRNSLLNKKFIKKILSYDIEEITEQKRRVEISKILSLLLIFFVKNKNKLVEFKLLPLTKKFLLTQIQVVTETKNLSNYLSCLYYICEPSNNIQCKQAELMKHQTIEKIIQCLDSSLPTNLVWCSVRLLKLFVKCPKSKQKMIQNNIIEKMFTVFKFNPRGVAQFVEEFMEVQKDKNYLQKYYNKFTEFINNCLMDKTLKYEELRQLLKIVKEGIKCFSGQQVFEFIQNDLLKIIWENFVQKQDLKVKEITLEIVNLILIKTDDIKVEGRPYALLRLEAMDFEKIIRQMQSNQHNHFFQPLKINKLVEDINDRYYSIRLFYLNQFQSQAKQVQNNQNQIINNHNNNNLLNLGANSNMNNNNNNQYIQQELPVVNDQQCEKNSFNKNLFLNSQYGLPYE